MPDTITCIAVLATTPTGEQLYLTIEDAERVKPLILQVKDNGHRIKKPKDDQPSFWYTENSVIGSRFTADSTTITADSTTHTADDDNATPGAGFLTLHPSLFDREINNGFHTREYWQAAYQRFSFTGSVEEVNAQMATAFNSIN